jgi:hypothetical protein
MCESLYQFSADRSAAPNDCNIENRLLVYKFVDFVLYLGVTRGVWSCSAK